MAENPRDYIRAAQAAELNGDRSGAADLLHRAAAVYARSGSLSRALQLLRRARSLDEARADIADAVQQLEREAEQATDLAVPGWDGGLEERLAKVPSSPEDVNEQQRLIEEALKAVDAGFEEEGGPRMWAVEEVSTEEVPSAVEWSVRSVSRLPPAGSEVPLESMDVRLQLSPVANGEQEQRSASEPQGFDRGPTRADPASDAWCSFCCRPSTEAGELVAGPAGAFICRACVGEADGLLADVAPVPRPAPARSLSAEPKLEGVALLAQDEAQALLERALAAGVRRLLVLGPEGAGKTTWLQALQARGQGTLVPGDALEQGPSAGVLLVEDVDRLSPEAQAALVAALARHPERTVVMSARGTLKSPGLVLRDGEARLSLHTTAALAQAVGGALPVGLLEQVQLAVPLRVLTKKEWGEVARHLLASRAPGVSATAEVLATLAAEAARSPRGGHELAALLARLPTGTWTLEAVKKRKPARRGRRKGRT